MPHEAEVLLAMAMAFLLNTGSLRIEAATNDAAAKAVNNLCHEEAYTNGLAKYIQDDLAEKERDADKLKKQKNHWRAVATTAKDAKSRCIYLALAMKAMQTTEQADATINSIKEHQLKTVMLLSEHSGALQVARTVANSKLAERANKHATTNQAKIHLALKLETSNNPACTHINDPKEITPSKTQPDYKKILALKITDPTKVHEHVLDLTATIGSAQGCTTNNQDNQPIGSLLDSCAKSGAWTLDGSHKKPPEHKYATTPTTIFSDNNYLGACDNSVTDPEKETNYAKKLAHYICTALKNAAQPLPSIADLSGATLKSDSLVLNVLRNCLPEYSGIQKSQDPKENSALAKFIEKEYTEKAATFTTQYVTNLQNNKPQARNDKETKPVSIVDTAGAEKLSEVLSYAEGERNKKELEAEKKDAATSKPIVSKNEEKCKGKPQGECKEEDGCEFKDGKCEAKVTTTTGTDGKTNTTGSSSFVIKKFPLLLAFLPL